jgi:hypothetical protein
MTLLRPDAVFIGWQARGRGRSPVALFNVVKPGHRLYASTVSENTLKAEGLSYVIPDILEAVHNLMKGGSHEA